MIYKYEIACREAGLSEERIKEIRKIFDDDKKKLKRENECMEKNDITYYSVFGVRPEYEDMEAYDIEDPSVNVEMEVIRKWEIEQLARFMKELSVDDRKFLYLYYEENGANDTMIARKLGIPRTTVQSRKKKLLKKLRKRFEEEMIEKN